MVTPAGYGPAPEFAMREARAGGPIEPGAYRVVASTSTASHVDFPTLDAARRYADDVASEADYDQVPPSAYVFDSSFECVDIGTHYGIRQEGKTAWESFQLYKSRQA